MERVYHTVNIMAELKIMKDQKIINFCLLLKTSVQEGANLWFLCFGSPSSGEYVSYNACLEIKRELLHAVLCDSCA